MSRLREYMLDYPYAAKKESHYISGRVYQYFIKREIILGNNIRFPEGIHLAEDLCFLMSVLPKIEKFLVWNRSIYNYYVIQGSAIHRYREKYFEEMCKVFKYLEAETDEALLAPYIYAQAKHAIFQCVRYYMKQGKVRECIGGVSNLLRYPLIREAYERLQFDQWTLFEKIENGFINKNFVVGVVFLNIVKILQKKVVRIKNEKGVGSV